MDKELMFDALEAALEGRDDVEPVNMFGGKVWKLNGNMLCGAGKDHFMFRVGKDQEAEALKRPGAKVMDFTGRRMGGFIWLDPEEGLRQNLKEWVQLAENYVGALAPK